MKIRYSVLVTLSEISICPTSCWSAHCVVILIPRAFMSYTVFKLFYIHVYTDFRVFVINVGYPLLGVQKWEGVPEHESFKSKCAIHEIHERQGDQESPKVCTHLKSCEPLYTCPRAPFIETQKDFYIPKLPSNLENIPSVNMYKNALYIP
jgi:hypothetical protein